MTFKFTGYNQSYLDETARKADSHLGRSIYALRWSTIKSFCSSGTLLDFGCGPGTFHEQAPDGFIATGWDINPNSKYSKCVPGGKYDILTMWDVIEHLSDPFAPIRNYKPEYVFICTPNADNTSILEFMKWKHFKINEHLHYYTPLTISMSMKSIGYDILDCNYDEGYLRDPQNPDAIFTAVFKCSINSSLN